MLTDFNRTGFFESYTTVKHLLIDTALYVIYSIFYYIVLLTDSEMKVISFLVSIVLGALLIIKVVIEIYLLLTKRHRDKQDN